MPLPTTASRRKGSDTLSSDKNKHVVRHDETKNEGQSRNETHQASNNAKKSELPVSTNVHQKSDADKTLHPDAMEKLALKAPSDSYLYESTEFAGVTVTIRTANATKPYGVSSVPGARRKSEFPQPVSGSQHGDKNDPAGANASTSTGKPEHSTNNSHGLSTTEDQH